LFVRADVRCAVSFLAVDVVRRARPTEVRAHVDGLGAGDEVQVAFQRGDEAAVEASSAEITLLRMTPR